MIEGYNGPRSGERPDVKLFQEAAAIPKELHGTMPKYMGRIGQALCDWLLPKLGMGRVYVTPFDHEGKPFYALRITVFFRSIRFTLSPVGAYFLGSGLSTLARFGSEGNFLLKDETLGVVYVPQWARLKTIIACADIMMRHKDAVMLVVEEIHRLQTVEGKDAPKDERTLN